MSEIRPGPALSATSDVPTVETPVEIPPAVPAVPVPPTLPIPTTVPAAPVSTPPVEPVARRFAELAQQRREADARAERAVALAETQSAQLEKALKAIENLQRGNYSPQYTPPVDGSVPRPVKESFADEASYEAALVTWAGSEAARTASETLRASQEEAERNRISQQEREAQERRETEARNEEARRASEIESAWFARRTAAQQKYPDFATVAEASSLPITTPMGHIIVTRDEGPDLVYWLGKNPTEAARIAALTVPGQTFPRGHPQAGLPIPNALDQAYELGKLAARLGPSNGGDGNPVPSTPAAVVALTNPPLPAPINPISAANALATRKDAADESMEEYAARVNRERPETVGRKAIRSLLQ